MPSRRTPTTWSARRAAIGGLGVAVALILTSLGTAATAFAASSSAKMAACDGVNLRTTATTTSTVKRVVPAGTTVTVVATIDGGSWTSTCNGRAVSGLRWYRISAVGGRSVSSLYGISYLYGATGLFTTVSAEAPVSVRTSLRPASGSRSGVVTEGIDVSHWQGVIDWTKVSEARKRFAYVKASDGTTFVDDRYLANRAGARAAGLYVGAYHFARPDPAAGDAVAEADHFVDTAAFARGDLLPVLDLEQAGGLSVSALQAWVKAFLGRVTERTGVHGIIYVSPSFWTKYLGDTTWFAEHGYQVLWIAHWTTAELPRMPASDWATRGWTFWQYSSSGTVPGISGRVDLDRYRGLDFSQVRIP